MVFTKKQIANLTSQQRELIEKAKEVKKNSYSIYSKFPVGASVLTQKGNIYVGTNMENASYGLSVCAEVGAIQSAVSAGDFEITKIAIVTNDKEKISTPCGRCRQIIFEAGEVSQTDIEVIIANKDNAFITTISQLIPNAFGPSNV